MFMLMVPAVRELGSLETTMFRTLGGSMTISDPLVLKKFVLLMYLFLVFATSLMIVDMMANKVRLKIEARRYGLEILGREFQERTSSKCGVVMAGKKAYIPTSGSLERFAIG